MLYPKSIGSKLGFDEVLEKARAFCQTQRGQTHFDKIKFSSDEDLVGLRLSQTAEIKEIIEKGDLSISIELDFDIFIKKARISGFFYEIETILQIKDFLNVLKRVKDYSLANKDEYNHLFKLFETIDVDFGLIDQIEKIIGIDNEINPSASKTLEKITASITRLEKNIIKSSNSLFENAKEKGLLGDTALGIKNGRVVLPVLSEHKRKFQGLLIDQSGTGKISYIEPLELVGLNNELSEFHIKRRQEIIIILKSLTADIVVYLDDIKNGMQRLSVLDFLRAKARLASEWNCIMPKLGKETSVTDAKHPILQERLKQESKDIVSLDYGLDDETRIVVISGPNAGGKSVALKTVGLFQYMLQCGFLVPCAEQSSFMLFENMFIDIGDNQSIESDLSTYSSHLKAAKHIINFSNEDTLVLMDEIGTGTDPMFGGPMAEAILEAIQAKNVFGIITTHFSNIKSKADKLDGVINAAMLFDVENLVPLYKLQLGQPGSSFVYEVASNIGLNRKLIKRAKQLTNTKQYDLDALLAEVQTQQEKIRADQVELAQKLRDAKSIEQEYAGLKSEITAQKKEIIVQAKEQASALILDANKEIEKTIRIIKENKADKQKTKSVRKKLSDKGAPASEVLIQKEEIIETSFKVGDTVQLINTSTTGEITEIKKNKATIMVGGMTTKTSLSNLTIIGKKTEKAIKKYISHASYSDKQLSFKSEKDVRGMRTYDALSEIDSWIDSAIILGVGSLRVLHGKGNGILKSEIRRHLKSNPAIAKITYEKVDLGGEGISIIELK